MVLTPLQERFCLEYVVDLNGAAAYRRAYPAANGAGAGKSASRLLTRPEVAARVAELKREREARTEISADWALRRLKAEAEFDGDGASHSARVSALALAMKHLGMFVGDAPHPERPTFDLSKLTDEQKSALLTALRSARGSAA